MSSDFLFWPSTVVSETKRQINAKIAPQLLNLAFEPASRQHKNKLVHRWFRDRVVTFDIISFQWNKYNPSFIVQFRSFDNSDDLMKCRNDLQAVNECDFGLRAHMTPRVSGWFRPSFIGSWLNLQHEVSKVVEKLSVTIDDIDNVMKGGKPTTPMQDHHGWRDKRLPENPPPWLETGGSLISEYHLPRYRVGKGRVCSTWEL